MEIFKAAMTASVEKATLKVVNQRIMVMVGPAEITFRTNEVGGGIVIDGHKTLLVMTAY